MLLGCSFFLGVHDFRGSRSNLLNWTRTHSPHTHTHTHTVHRGTRGNEKILHILTQVHLGVYLGQRSKFFPPSLSIALIVHTWSYWTLRAAVANISHVSSARVFSPVNWCNRCRWCSKWCRRDALAIFSLSLVCTFVCVSSAWHVFDLGKIFFPSCQLSLQECHLALSYPCKVWRVQLAIGNCTDSVVNNLQIAIALEGVVWPRVWSVLILPVCLSGSNWVSLVQFLPFHLTYWWYLVSIRNFSFLSIFNSQLTLLVTS